MVKRTITITTVLLILSMIVSLIIILNRESFAADDDIASGIAAGGVNWRITADGELIIGNGTEQTFANLDYFDLNYKFPWAYAGNATMRERREKIKSVRFDGIVHANGDMQQMFGNCTNVETIDLTGFETSNATVMSSMFSGCKSLKSVNIELMDMSNVEAIGDMFNNCRSLEALNLSNFNTSKVSGRGMTNLFYFCESLEELDCSTFDTSEIEGFGGIFGYCKKLKRLNISSFDTSNAHSFYETSHSSTMFNGCESLEFLDLSHFDVSKVGIYDSSVTGADNGFASLFYGCSSLRELNISNWDVSHSSNFYRMFEGCSSLTSLDISNWNVSQATNMDSMFRGCSSLTSFDCNRWNVMNVTRMNNMFENCSSLTTLDLSSFICTVTADHMFSGTDSLEELDISNMTIAPPINYSGYGILGPYHFYTTFDPELIEGGNFYSNLKKISFGPGFHMKESQYPQQYGGSSFFYSDFPIPHGAAYTGKWISEDGTLGPYTNEELRNELNSDAYRIAGTWIWEEKEPKYYVRYSYSDFIPEGASELPIEETYHQGDEITVAPNATAPGYTFSGWSRTGTFEMLAEDVEITGSFIANTDTPYKVEHYLEDLNADTYTLTKTDNLTGITDTEVTATQKDYEGFTFDDSIDESLETGTINGYGTLVLKLYYKRNSYNVSYSYTGEIPEDASTLPQDEIYEYGAEINVPDDGAAEGYTFSGWIKDYITMPAQDIEITGYFIEKPKSYSYKVEYFFDGEIDETLEEILNAEKDEEILLTPQTPLKHGEKNYTLVSNNHKIIITANDEENKIKVYYETDVLDCEIDNQEDTTEGDGIPDKYQISIIYKVENGSWNDGTKEIKTNIITLRDKEGNYSENGEGNTNVPQVGNRPNEGYTFGNWNKAVPGKVSSKNNENEYIYSYERVAKAGIMPTEGKSSNPKTGDRVQKYFTYGTVGLLILIEVVNIRRKYSRRARKIQF